MSIFSQSRCVLLMADEALGVYDTGGGRVQLLDTLPWETQDLEEAIVEIIKKRSRSKSILILNDTVEQHYRKERVPKVSSFDRANLIKRRVSAAFPSYPIRSALKLKEKPAEEGGETYLFGALPSTDNIRKTLSAVQKSYRPVAGLCLLPVESAAMVYTLSKKMAKGFEKPPVWSLFVGQHRNGGLRQIVTKNGELALTRMTPIIDSDDDEEIWAQDVANEIKGTMGYLSRFGFDKADGLDVTVVAGKQVDDLILSKLDFDCNLNVMTCIEVANTLGIGIGRQEDQRYADVLHVGWSGRKSALTMPLQGTEMDEIATHAKIATMAAIVLVAACGYFAYESYNQATTWSANSKKLTAAQQTLNAVRESHAQEVEKNKNNGIDFVRIDKSTTIFETLDRKAMKPLTVFDTIGRLMGPDLHLKSLNVKPMRANPLDAAGLSVGAMTAPPAEEVPPEGTEAAPPKKEDFDLVLKIILPKTLAPEVGVQMINDLQKRLQTGLPDHKVSTIKQVADFSYTGNFVGEAGNQQLPDAQKQDYEAEILIRGPLQ